MAVDGYSLPPFSSGITNGVALWGYQAGVPNTPGIVNSTQLAAFILSTVGSSVTNLPQLVQLGTTNVYFGADTYNNFIVKIGSTTVLSVAASGMIAFGSITAGVPSGMAIVPDGNGNLVVQNGSAMVDSIGSPGIVSTGTVTASGTVT